MSTPTGTFSQAWTEVGHHVDIVLPVKPDDPSIQEGANALLTNPTRSKRGQRHRPFPPRLDAWPSSICRQLSFCRGRSPRCRIHPEPARANVTFQERRRFPMKKDGEVSSEGLSSIWLERFRAKHSVDSGVRALAAYRLPALSSGLPPLNP